MGYYTLKKTTNKQYMFNLHADNNQVILTSETYTTKGAAIGGISAVRENSPHDGQYKRLDGAGGSYRFTLHARNGETIGRSENYTTAQGRETGIASVKANGPGSRVIDETGE